MKKLTLLGLALILITACKQEQRYFTSSPEIDSLKAGIADYENGNWDTWQDRFADTAKIYVNSKESKSVSERTAELKELANAFSSYGFEKEDQYAELVIDDDGERWVNYWANWTGILKANAKTISVPVHLTNQYIDGKVVEEYVYYDGTPLYLAMQELAEAVEGEEQHESEDGDGDNNDSGE